MDKTAFDALWSEVVNYARFATDKSRMPVPGLAMAAVALIDGAWQVMEHYQGLRDVRHDDWAVGKDTVFQLASVSKPISATVIAALIAKGALGKQGWDMVARDVGLDQRPTTIAELLCHLSGLPSHAGDVIEDMGGDRTTVLGKLGRYQREPAPAPYAYTNFGYTAAAEAAARATGKDWEALADALLYTPLGMTQTSSRHADFIKRAQHVSLHQKDDRGHWFVGEQRNPDAQSPAGGVSATALDLSRWMRLCLGDRSLIADEAFHAELAKALQPHTPAQIGPTGKTYSLGWNMSVDTTGRVYQLGHSGAFNLGAATCVTLLPQQKLGIVVLTNGWPIGVPEAISAAFALLARDPSMTVAQIEHNRDAPPGRDGKTLLEGVAAYMEHELRPPPRIPYAREPVLPTPPDYAAGEYVNPLYGSVKVGRDAGGIYLQQGNRHYPLGASESPNVLIYDSAGENGTRDNGLSLHNTDFPRIWVDNLFYAYPQGAEATPRSQSDSATGVETILVDRPVSISGLVRVWRLYAARPGQVQLRVYNQDFQLLDQSDVVSIDGAGFHQLVLPRAIQKPFRYFGFYQPACGVICYEDEIAAKARIRYPGQPDWADFQRSYSIQIDVDAHGVFTK